MPAGVASPEPRGVRRGRLGVTVMVPARGLGRHRVVVTAAGFSSTSSPPSSPFLLAWRADGAGLGCSRAWAGGSGALVAGSVTPRSGGGVGDGEAVEWRGASGGVTCLAVHY